MGDLYGWKDVPDIEVQRINKTIAIFDTTMKFYEMYDRELYEYPWEIVIQNALTNPKSVSEITKENNNIYLKCTYYFRSKETGEDEKKEIVYGPGYLQDYNADVDTEGDPAVFFYHFRMKCRLLLPQPKN